MTTYTLRYNKSGIMQYAYFIVDEDQILVNPTFSCTYQAKDSWPDVSNCTKLEQVIKRISDYSYDKKCEIWKINNILYCSTKKDIDELTFISDQLYLLFKQFYDSIIKPKLPKNGKIAFGTIYINKKDIKDIPKYQDLYNDLNYLSYKFLYNLNLVEYNDFESEVEWVNDYLYDMLIRVPDETRKLENKVSIR